MNRLIVIFFLSICSLQHVTCQIPVGTWRDHLSWNTAEAVVIAGRKVYCSNGAGISVYDMQSRQLDKLTKINGLSDAGITALQYAASLDVVVAGYANGNLDIIASGNKVYNISGIKRNDIYINKRINHIFVWGKHAYLSCQFGIVLIDLQLREIPDRYIIGDDGIPADVFSLTEYNGFFYAATAHGLKKADTQNSELANFEHWEKIDNAPSENTLRQIVSTKDYLYVCDTNNRILIFDGTTWKLLRANMDETIHRLTVSGNSLLVSSSNGVFIYHTTTNLLQNSIQSYNNTSIAACDAIMDSNGSCWIADNRQGLVQWRSASDISFYLPNGPTSNHAAALRFKADRLLVASGGKDRNGLPLNRQGEIHTFYANQWSSIIPQGAYNFTDVDIYEKHPTTYYVTSWGQGLYVYENGVQKDQYLQNNSSLVADVSGNVLCGGLLIDADQNLWVSNDKQVSMFGSGQWKTLPWQTTASLGRFTGDNYGQMWTTQDYNRITERYNGLLVFSKTSDAYISFKPNNYVLSPIDLSNSVVNTPDGIVWVATVQGPVKYGNPSVILDGIGTGGSHPNRIGSDEPSHMYPLLGMENILSIAIDGAYRKWFGTETAGVFLIDENLGEVKHFTTDNSPLFSNRIHDIAINDRTGEVFFATEYGIVAYRGDAVSSGDNFGKVYAFPNPVRPEYQGEITITGLIRDADVKITDIAGNLVYQTRTLGGQAVWNGRNQQGRRVASNVYLVFCTNNDGSKTYVTKIMFIH